MPFDGQPKDYETKPEVFSLAGLIAWLETQDPETEYSWLDPRFCLLCRYSVVCGGTDVYHRLAESLLVIEEEVAFPHPHTFGAALQRALGQCSGTPK